MSRSIIATATISSPKISPQAEKALLEETIMELKKDYTIVIVTHNLQQAARIADYTGFMFLGHLIEFGDTEELFTTMSVPVMTRLRQEERLILDTLVDAGVARSRSEALAWAVRLVGEHAEEWLSSLRDAMSKVDDLRAQGPEL